jgi:hypothetical protein
MGALYILLLSQGYDSDGRPAINHQPQVQFPLRYCASICSRYRADGTNGPAPMASQAVIMKMKWGRRPLLPLHF